MCTLTSTRPHYAAGDTPFRRRTARKPAARCAHRHPELHPAATLPPIEVVRARSRWGMQAPRLPDGRPHMPGRSGMCNAGSAGRTAVGRYPHLRYTIHLPTALLGDATGRRAAVAAFPPTPCRSTPSATPTAGAEGGTQATTVRGLLSPAAAGRRRSPPSPTRPRPLPASPHAPQIRPHPAIAARCRAKTTRRCDDRASPRRSRRAHGS